jgi:hypothetical protein
MVFGRLNIIILTHCSFNLLRNSVWAKYARQHRWNWTITLDKASSRISSSEARTPARKKIFINWSNITQNSFSNFAFPALETVHFQFALPLHSGAHSFASRPSIISYCLLGRQNGITLPKVSIGHSVRESLEIKLGTNKIEFSVNSK